MTNENDAEQSEQEIFEEFVRQYLARTSSASEEDYKRLRQFQAQYAATDLTDPQRATDEEARTIYSEEAQQQLLEAALRIAFDDIEDQKLSHNERLWADVIDSCFDEHEQRVTDICLFFHQKRTGELF